MSAQHALTATVGCALGKPPRGTDPHIWRCIMKGLATAYCTQCAKDRPYHYVPVNHWRQLLLTIFTMGLWLPIWLAMVFCPTKVCNQCGGPIWHR